MRRIRKIAGFLFAVALAVIGLVSPAQAGPGSAKYILPTRKPVVDNSPSLKRENDRQTLQASLAVPGGATREDLEKLQKKIRMRVADGYVRHISAPAPSYFPVENEAYTPQVFQGAAFVQTAHRFIKANQNLICTPSNRVSFVTDKRRQIESRGFVRMQQMYDGLPVLGASVIVQTHGADGVTAVFSDVLRDLTRLENGLIPTVPKVTSEFAQNAAIRVTSNDKYPADQLEASESVLTFYDPSIFGMPGELQLVWDTKVRLRDRVGPVGERVLVNARTGEIVLHFNEVRTSMYRSVLDYEDRPWATDYTADNYRKYFNVDNNMWPRGVGKCRRWDEERACGNHQYNSQPHLGWPGLDEPGWTDAVIVPVPWCNIAYAYLADIYNFYYSQHRRDSYGPPPDPFGEGPGPIQDHGMHEIWHAPGMYPTPYVYIDPEPIGGVQGYPYGEGYEMMLTTRINEFNAFFQDLGPDGDYGRDQNLMHIAVGTRLQACDDVIAHEFTHGVTHWESGLFYMTESGAIDESLSDMWGEWIDLTNTPYGTIEGPTARAVRWVLGEDTDCPYDGGARGRPIGYYRPEAEVTEWEIARSLAARDMRNPPYYGQPDKMTSPYFWTQMGDNGGVHMNSGIINKLAYLLTDGDTFNNQVVLGMGINDEYSTYTYYSYPKPPTSSRTAPELFYEVQCNLLTPTCDFEDLYYALLQACDNLGMSEAEKQNVDKACAAVEIKPARISEAYNIVYKDKRNPALKAIVDDETNEIIIADPQAYGTLKITKNKNFPKNRLYDTPHGATIRYIHSGGSLLDFYTEADVDVLDVNNELPSVTAKGCNIKQIWANEVGKVRETDYARSWSTSHDMDMTNVYYPGADFTTGEYYLTSIYSNWNWTPGRLKSGARPLQLQLDGVGSLQVYAPGQSVTASVSTKKWKVPVYRRDVNTDQLKIVGYSDDLSYAGTPSDLYATAGIFRTGELKSYKSVGATFRGQEFSSVARTPVVTDIKSYSLVTTPYNSGFKYVIYYVNRMSPALLDLGSDKLRMENVGGWLSPTVAQVAGEISSLRARSQWYVVTDATTVTETTTGTIVYTYRESWGSGGLVGLYYSDGSPYDDISIFRSGTDPSADFQNIVDVQASNFIRGNFQAGVEFDGEGNAVAVRGNIKSMKLTHLLTDDVFTTTPVMMGHGWTATRPKFTGDHSQFILHDLPYVPTDPH